jgi:hypothetical protein
LDEASNRAPLTPAQFALMSVIPNQGSLRASTDNDAGDEDRGLGIQKKPEQVRLRVGRFATVANG